MEERLAGMDPVAKEHLYVKVADAITAHIRDAGLKVGDKLPSERQMAAMFSAGRNTVREALRVLQEEGTVKVASSRGAYVNREVPDERAMKLELMKINYRDLLEIKMWLEQLAIRRAVLSATDAQLDELIRRAESLRKMEESGQYSKEQDRTFHTQLLSCGGSSTLAQLVLSLIDELNRYANLLDCDKEWLVTVPFHMDIARGLRERRLSLALAAHEYIHQCDMRVLDTLDARRMEDADV